MKDTIWRTRDGVRIPVSKMKRTHIEHCIARIKHQKWRENFLARLELELRIRDILGRKD